MKYVANPVTLEAWQFDGDNWGEIQSVVGERKIDIDAYMSNFIDVREMWVDIPAGIVALVWVEPSKQWAGVKPGDYIVKDSAGDFYPCEKSIFERKYSSDTDLWKNTDKKITLYFKKSGNVMMYVETETEGSGGIVPSKESIFNEINASYPEFQGGVVTAEQIYRAVGRSIQQSRRFQG